jgi:isopenicillin-N N-acyltransferase-like protein
MANGEFLPAVTVTGTPFERGITHGQRFEEEIETNLETYFDWFDRKGWDQERLIDHGSDYLSLVENVNEEYAEEMRGVAEGSDVPIDHITLLNARYEAMYPAIREDLLSEIEAEESLASAGMTSECSTLGVQPEVTADGHTYLGQNWDWLPPLENVVLRVDQDAHANMAVMTEAGIVGGKTGVNEHGIGLGVNGLRTMSDGENPDRKPFHVRCREILNADRLDRAIAPITSTYRVCSANFLVGHASGEILDLETAPEDIRYIYPEDGILGHSNHFTDSSGIDIVDKRHRFGTNTLLRANRIERLLRREAGDISEDTVKSVLRDHFDAPEGSQLGVCKHPDSDLPVKDQVQTNCSFVMDLDDRRMVGAVGPPCEHEYKEYRVPT